VALVKEQKLSFWERLFFLPFIKGLWLTFTMLFRKKVTRQYPEEKLKVFEEIKGHPVLVRRPDGKPRCVACGLCEFACPPRAIYIVGKEIDDPIERAPEIFEVDTSRCIMCGFCEEACPKEAIVMSHEIEFAASDRKDLTFDLERLLVDEEEVKDRLDYIRKTFERWKT
jgi:NADH-quinone oxidoreductase subunit I